MRRRSAILLGGLVLGGSLGVCRPANAATKRPKHGGFGFASVGFLAGKIGGVSGALSRSTTLGGGGGPIAYGYQLGGGGRMLLARRLILGGKGFALLSPQVGGPNGTALLRGGGGGLDVGVAAVNRDRWLFYPFFGAGGFGYDVRLRNESQSPIRFGDAKPLLPSKVAHYGSGFAYLEGGLGLQRLLFHGDGGFMVGMEAGAMFSVAPQQWQDSAGNTIHGVSRPVLQGGYLKLTIGGGGFHRD